MTSLQRAIDPLSGPLRPRNRRRNPFWRFRRFLFSLVLLVVGAIGAVLYTFSQTNLPEDRFEAIAQTSFLCTAEVTANCGPDNATVLLSTAGEDREIVTYEELPQSVIDAVVATEDQSYFEHQGVDPRGITRAAYRFLRQEGVTQGGSTITQQYVKLAFNDADRTLIRKAREAIRAVKLEQDLARECSETGELGTSTPEQCAKEEILTRYLNRAYFGRGASGVQAAARTYFGKEAGELDIAESAFLAGLLRNPNGADPDVDRDEANRRRTTSLQNMLDAGFITAAEAAEANESGWNVVPRRDREGLGEVAGAEWGTEYFVEEVRQQLDELYPNGEIYTSGIRVYTTLDPRLQQAAYNAAHAPKVGEDLEARGKPQLGPTYLDPNNPDEPAAAIISLDSDGRVLAMLGGTNFDEDEFNLATSSGTNGRQPGSTFKPIGLAVAIEQGISARSFYPAIPGVTRVGGPCVDDQGPWQVTGGSSGQYRYRDLIDALTWSSNVVFAQLVVDIGPEQLRLAAEDLGIGSELLVDLDLDGTGDVTPCSLILGSQGVPVIDMASVYSTFERGGTQLDPVLIERVEDINGEVICWYPTNGVCSDGPVRQGTAVFSQSTTRQLTYAMSQVTGSGTGRAAVFAEDRAVAGKTGTSQESRDGWFAGYTCGMTTVVWMGHSGEEETPMIDFRKPLAEGELEPPPMRRGISSTTGIGPMSRWQHAHLHLVELYGAGNGRRPAVSGAGHGDRAPGCAAQPGSVDYDLASVWRRTRRLGLPSWNRRRDLPLHHHHDDGPNHHGTDDSTNPAHSTDPTFVISTRRFTGSGKQRNESRWQSGRDDHHDSMHRSRGVDLPGQPRRAPSDQPRRNPDRWWDPTRRRRHNHPNRTAFKPAATTLKPGWLR